MLHIYMSGLDKARTKNVCDGSGTGDCPRADFYSLHYRSTLPESFICAESEGSGQDRSLSYIY